MALRWTGAAMLEAAKGFRRIKAPQATAGPAGGAGAHQARNATNSTLEQQTRAA
jgi:putative transposase